MIAVNKRTGARIIGTLETIPGVALIKNIQPGLDGKPTFDWDGGTELNWDSQETVTDENDLTIFVDEDGETCTENDIEYRDEDEDPE